MVELVNLSVIETNEAYCRLRKANGLEGVSRGFLLQWTKPEASVVKINVDGASHNNAKRAVVGYIARNH